MIGYYMNREHQKNGDHEIHMSICHKLPKQTKEFLGMFENCKDALAEAKTRNPMADGCALCSPDCHSR